MLFIGRGGAIHRPGRADLELRGVRPHEGSQQLDRVVPGHVVLQRIYIYIYIYSCCSTLYVHVQLDRVAPVFCIQTGTDIDASINAPCMAAPDEKVGGLEQVQQHLPADGSTHRVPREYP